MSMTTGDPKRTARDFRDLVARFRNAAGDERRAQEAAAMANSARPAPTTRALARHLGTRMPNMSAHVHFPL